MSITDKRIIELPTATELASNDYVGIDNALDGTRKIRAGSLGEDMFGATAQQAGTRGYVPAPEAGDNNKALFGDATWKTIEVPTALSDLSDDSTHRTVTDTEKTTWNSKADESDIPTTLAELSDDSTHRLVTDTEKAAWDAKANVVANPLGEATGELKKVGINNAIYKIVGGEKVYGEASGAIASFSDGSANPLADLKIGINPVQAGSGDPSPSNPRAISGWTGANISVVGSNLINPSYMFGTSTIYTVNSNGSITTSSSNGKAWMDNTELPPLFIKAGTYTITRSDPTGSMQIRSSLDNYANNLIDTANASATFTLSEDCYIKMKINTGSGATYPNTTFVYLEVGSPATTYKDYVGSVVPISWQTEAGEVFGGELDVTSGVLKSTYKRVKAKDLTWNYYSGSGGYFSSASLNEKELGSINIKAEIFITSESTSITYMEENSIKGSDTTRIYIRCGDAAGDVDALKTILGESYIIYEISEPNTYQLTPTQVSSILETNNIWADTGDSDVVYIRDLNLCINDLINRIEALENA